VVFLTALTETATAAATGIAPVGTGTHQITANCAGDGIYSPSSYATIGLTATGFAITGTAVTVAPGAATGNTSTITVTPSGNFTGKVALTATIASSPTGAQYLPTLSFGYGMAAAEFRLSRRRRSSRYGETEEHACGPNPDSPPAKLLIFPAASPPPGQIPSQNRQKIVT
jgi:hypothetical protein